MQQGHSFINKVKGGTAIEFAIVFPIYLLLIFGIIELGYVFWGISSLHYGASFGARYAFVNPTASTTSIENQALSYLSLPTNAITYTVTQGSQFIDIDGVFSYSFLYLPIDPVSVTTHVRQVLPLN